MVVGWFTLPDKIAFLDRDGVINVKAPEHDYIKIPSEFVFLPKAKEAIRLLNENGYIVLVMTNQRGIARKIMNEEDLSAIHAFMLDELRKVKARVDGIYVCPHEKGQCRCRKPDIGLFLQAEKDFEINKQSSWMIGDSKSDIEAGIKYGVKTVKIGESCGIEDYVCENLWEAANLLIRSEKR